MSFYSAACYVFAYSWGLSRATGPLHVPSTLHIPYKHLSHAPEPVTLSCTCTLVEVTSLNLDYLTFPLFSCIFLFLSCTQHEPLTKPLCQDLVQHNTVYSSFSRSFLSFLTKFLILYVRSIKQLNIYVAFFAPLHYQELLKSFPSHLAPTQCPPRTQTPTRTR